MIPRTCDSAYPPSWHDELKNLVTDPKTLFQALDLPLEQLPGAESGHQLFKVRVTRPFLARIKPGDLNDPLLKQVLPTGLEEYNPEGFCADPLAEKAANPVQGVIHKYHGRVLLIAASQCAINCRYCFRREFDYSGNQMGRAQWQAALDYIAGDRSIKEVILSGGDPLVLADKQLAWLTEQIASLGHITRLRIHSRLPIVLPSRITPELLAAIQHPNLQTLMVVHCNHAQEIDAPTSEALQTIRGNGIHLLNQTVLLAGINNELETLQQLSEALFQAGALPYYLHLLDKVNGAAQFDFPQDQALQLHQQLQAKLPGYLVPKLVREQPGEPQKTLIFHP